MEVRCERCQTEYDFDESLVTERGVAVKCTQCGHLFTVYPRSRSRGRSGPQAIPPPPPSPVLGPHGAPALPGAPPPAAGGYLPERGSTQPPPPPPAAARPAEGWLLRPAGATAVYTFQDWGVLRRWAQEGRVGPQDEVTLPGGVWQQLGMLPELAGLFRRSTTPGEAYVSGPPPVRAPEGFVLGEPAAVVAGHYPSGPYSLGTPPTGLPAGEAPRLATANGPQRERTPVPSWTGPALRWASSGPQPPRTATPVGPGYRSGPLSPQPGRSSTPLPLRDGFGEFDGFEDYLSAVGYRSSGRRWLLWVGGIAALLLLVGGLFYLYQDSPLLALKPQVASGVAPGSEASPTRATVAPAPAPERGAPASAAAAVVVAGAAPGTTTVAAGAPAAPAALAPPTIAPVQAVPPAAPSPTPAVALAAPAPAAPLAAPAAVAPSSPPRPAAPPVAAAAAPASFDGMMSAAHELLIRDKAAAALALYERAALARPSSAEPLTGIGWCHLDLGRAHIAVIKFKQALGFNPDFGDALIGLGKAYRVQGNKELAREAYQRYLTRQPFGSKASIAKAALEQLGPAPAAETPAPPSPPSPPTPTTAAAPTTSAAPTAPPPTAP